MQLDETYTCNAMRRTRNDIFPLAETTPLLRLTAWLIVGIVAGALSAVAAGVWLVSLGLATATALALRRRGLAQSVAIAVAMFALGATLAARQRDVVARSGMTARQWLQRQNVPDGSTRLGRSRLFFMQQRERLLAQFRQQGLEGEGYALVAAMTLGDKRALNRDIRRSYDVSGASHVLALSGLHMGIVYALLTLLVRGRRRRIVTQALVVTALWGFVALVGMPVSAVRAATMLTLYALLTPGYRERASLNALALTAMVLLMVNPYTLFDVGFQMSFLAVLSILVLTPLLSRTVPADVLQRHRLMRWLWGMTTVSIAAQMGVAPLLAYYFGRVATYFLLTNIVVMPLVVVVLWLALAALVIPQLTPLLALVVDGLNRGVSVIALLPGASIEGLRPTLLQVALCYVVMLCGYWAVCLLWPRGVTARRCR